jgi:demethylmenaquinone methyltransferase/2-methoxy-6-polyprenyl-1,4-benzoquinol methylase
MPFDHFDAIAGLYNRTSQFSLGQPLLGWIDPTGDACVLDAGGGTGRLASKLQSKVRRIFLADVSMGMMKYSLEKNIPCVCAPAECLPFQANSFDRVLMRDALHHVQNQAMTCEEFWRILKPGGRILIIEPDIKKISIKLIALAEKLLLMRSHFLSGEKIQDLFGDKAPISNVFRFENNVVVLIEKPDISKRND